MMIMDISTSLAALKSMAEFAKLIISSKVDAAVREKAIELQSIIISLNSDMFSMQAQYGAVLQANQALEQKIAELEQWETEAARYELKEIVPAVFVYAIKPESATAEPSHWICPDCYQNKRKSILQRKTKTRLGTIYACLSCGAQIVDHTKPLPAPVSWSG